MDERYAEGGAAYEAGDYEAAAGWFQGLVSQTGDRRARCCLAACLYRLGRIDEAREHWTAVLTAKDQDALLYYNLGLVEAALGHPTSAEAYFLAAIRQAPGLRLAQQALDALIVKRSSDGSLQPLLPDAVADETVVSDPAIPLLPDSAVDETVVSEPAVLLPATDVQHVAYCPSCQSIERSPTASSLDAYCGQCGTERRSWAVPASTSFILARADGDVAWTGESYDTVRQALLAGELRPDDLICEIAPVLAAKAKDAQSEPTTHYEWLPLHKVRAFPVRVLFHPVLAHAERAAPIGGMVGSIATLLSGVITVFLLDPLPGFPYGLGFWQRLVVVLCIFCSVPVSVTIIGYFGLCLVAQWLGFFNTSWAPVYWTGALLGLGASAAVAAGLCAGVAYVIGLVVGLVRKGRLPAIPAVG